jgi:TolA-binding protein
VACCFLGTAGCADPQVTKAPDNPNMVTGASAPDKGWKIKDDWYNPSAYFKPDPPTPATEVLTLRAEGFVADKPPAPNTPEAEIAGAHDLYRRGDFETAEKLFHYHAEKTADSGPVRCEARFYEAECLRLQGEFPKAADCYVDVLNKYPQNPYREACLQHCFDIANFWLEDTREEMKEEREKREGKRWVVWPRFFCFDKKKPFMDEQGRAIEKLEQIRYNEINGPLADKALFLCGSVKFFNEDFKDADFYFSQIYERHKDSPLASQAIELAIISKHLSTGGADYDGKKVVEARKLVQAAFASYPELAGDEKKRRFLSDQLISITLQQAEKDYRMAEFWRRFGHPGSAYWYYGLVIQRYPTTEFARLSQKRMEEIRADVEKENAGKAPPPKMPTPDRDPGRPPAPTTQLPGGVVPGGRP